MGVALGAHVIDKRHGWTVCDPYVGSIHRSVSLTREVFQAPLKNDSMDFKDIVSTSVQPGYWSPAAPNINAQTLDLQLLRDCKDNMPTMEHAWLGGTTCFCSCSCYGAAVVMLCLILLCFW